MAYTTLQIFLLIIIITSIARVALSVISEKPIIHSSYFQQLMQDAASTLQAESSNNATADNVDRVTCEHSPCDSAPTTSSQPPVDSSKTAQQLIGSSALIAHFTAANM